ncbi:MAG TPA: hypothetical protein VFQ41_09160 [Candidatus Angelobacter sp.]|nr:hypothetical protein [Candidatus Angelobacter sp.]
MDVKAEEEKYADAQKEGKRQSIAALAPHVTGVYVITVSGSGDPHIFEKEARELGKAIAAAAPPCRHFPANPKKNGVTLKFW